MVGLTALKYLKLSATYCMQWWLYTQCHVMKNRRKNIWFHVYSFLITLSSVGEECLVVNRFMYKLLHVLFLLSTFTRVPALHRCNLFINKTLYNTLISVKIKYWGSYCGIHLCWCTDLLIYRRYLYIYLSIALLQIVLIFLVHKNSTFVNKLDKKNGNK